MLFQGPVGLRFETGDYDPYTHEGKVEEYRSLGIYRENVNEFYALCHRPGSSLYKWIRMEAEPRGNG